MKKIFEIEKLKGSWKIKFLRTKTVVNVSSDWMQNFCRLSANESSRTSHNSILESLNHSLSKYIHPKFWVERSGDECQISTQIVNNRKTDSPESILTCSFNELKVFLRHLSDYSNLYV